MKDLIKKCAKLQVQIADNIDTPFLDDLKKALNEYQNDLEEAGFDLVQMLHDFWLNYAETICFNTNWEVETDGESIITLYNTDESTAIIIDPNLTEQNYVFMSYKYDENNGIERVLADEKYEQLLQSNFVEDLLMLVGELS